jgi:hypothetical protein
MLAAAQGHALVVSALLRFGASPLIQDQDGRVALHGVAWAASPATVTALLGYVSLYVGMAPDHLI